METSQRILKGAEELFFRYGIKSITMDDISRHLAVSKKTIYQSFKDKDELVDKLTEHTLMLNQCEFNRIQSISKDPIAEIIEMMKHAKTMFSKMNANLFYDMMRYHPGSWQRFKKFKDEMMLGMVESNLTRGIQLGLYREELNPKVLARLRMEQVTLAMNPDAFPPDKFSHVDVQMQILIHFLYGVCTLKGHRLINKYRQLHEED
jgi:AcrR family transcriptional regulator